MTDLLFLTDASQVEALGEESRDLLDHARVVTADMATAARLEELGVPFIDAWDLLSSEDLHAHWVGARDLSRRWWEEALTGSGQHDFPLAGVATTELFWSFQWCLNARLIYDRLLDSLPVRAVYGYFFPPTAVIVNGPLPWERSMTSLSHAVLRWCADRRGLPIRRLKITRPLSHEVGAQNHEPAPAPDSSPLPAGCEPTLWVSLLPGQPGRPDWLGDARRRAPARPGVRTAVVMQFLASREAVGLEKMFTRTPGWRMVRVCHYEAPDPGVACWPWHDGEAMRPFRVAKRAFDSARNRYTGAYPELFANPFLRFQLDKVWAEIFKAARLGESFRSMLKTVGANLVVFGYDGFVVERMLARVARSEGVPTAALLHGALGHAVGSHDFVADADHMIVVGEKDVQDLVRNGWEPERVQAVGSLRFGDQYQSGMRKGGGRAEARAAARRQLGIPDDKPTVVLMTSAILGQAYLAQPSAHRATWRGVARLAARRSDLTFFIKPHPGRDYYELYSTLCREGPANLVFSRDAMLGTALDASNAAVLVNLCTTAALEAMLHGTPVVFLRTAIYPCEATVDSLQDGGAVSVNDIAGLEASLDRLIRDDDYRRTALAEAEAFLASFFAGAEGAALERFMRAWDRIALASVPAGGDGSAEPEIHRRLTRAAAQLSPGGRREEFLTTWKGLVDVLASAPPSRAGLRQILFRLSYDVGLAVEDPVELRSLVRRCCRAARGPLSLSAREGRNMTANACLAAMTCRLRAGAWAQAAALYQQALHEAPRAVARFARSPLSPQVLALALGEAQKASLHALSLQHDLAGLHSSWAWKMGRLLVRPGSLLKQAIRGRQKG